MSAETGQLDLYQKASSGASSQELLLKSDYQKFPTDWSSDGQFIAFYAHSSKPNSKWELWVYSFRDRKATPFLQTEFNAQTARFSPDVHWIAYVSDESGTEEVYVRPFPGPGGKWQISSGGGSQPRWRRDGKELTYRSQDQKLMAVEIKSGSTFEAGTPRTLFPLTAAIAVDSASDNKRFLLATKVGEESPTSISVVLNWTAGLKR
jgi:Tol biopolymer transport system component